MSTLSLTVLGAGTPYPRPDNACSGYLLRTEQSAVWVDAGPGSLANLQRHVSPDQLSAIWISHLHADHFADLASAYYALAFSELRPRHRIPVYAPIGWGGRLEAFLTNSQVAAMSAVFEEHELHDGHQVEIADLRLTSRAVHHGIPAFGLRAEHNGRVLAYSGDTGPCAALDELASGADVLLCEADADEETEVHCTPEDAGEAARKAGVKQLLITHVGPAMTPEFAAGRAAKVFGGRTVAVAENEIHELR
ncbi:MBL fold metallo-hydrolase [Allokutzneria albata]|uniref:Ribonuclease BN, tRNA processing enzyme n=1 Tax=Allokutzneria albata TaxID=211114 RepID=A0A1G9ZN61_ALLAB|nr:MBL fold metallo-hydrolase [Allokutzneria albata]SDN22674.1 Ribonuclease BN, tRNA processing enzyme [Allokutzneria albata]